MMDLDLVVYQKKNKVPARMGQSSLWRPVRCPSGEGMHEATLALEATVGRILQPRRFLNFYRNILLLIPFN